MMDRRKFLVIDSEEPVESLDVAWEGKCVIVKFNLATAEAAGVAFAEITDEWADLDEAVEVEP